MTNKLSHLFAALMLLCSSVAMAESVTVQMSTTEEQHWYFITNAGTQTYSAGKVMFHDASSNAISFGDAALMNDRLWSFWQGSNGKLAIKNYNNVYLGTAPAGTGNNTALSGTTTENAIYSIEAFDDAFIITDGNGQPLHAQQDGKKIVRWQAASGNASLWTFNEVDVSNPETGLSFTLVQQGKVTTARGNKDQGILRSTLTVQGLTGELPLTQVKGKLVATKLSDITAVRAYLATNAQELYVDKDNGMPWREQNGTFLGEGTINADGTYTIPIENTNLTPGQHYLWIAIDIDPEAKEGNTVDATITGYTAGGEEVAENNGNPQYAATIFLAESAVLMPMDKGSLYYRIPAITATADGKRLVTLTDDRKSHNADLPTHCYVVAQYSDDGGKTWSDPKCVAGEAATGGNYGHGDAQIITNRYTGEIIGIMTSSPTSNAGFFGSTVEQPQAWKVIKSADGGETWSVPVNHTTSLYAKNSPNPTIKAGFSGSGAGLQKRDGTLISPFVARNTDNVNHYYNIISKDGGDTWEIYGTSGTSGADEPKVLERNNGDIAISVRASGYNFHNVSTDDGKGWKQLVPTRFNTGISGNACDGEYMVWCSTLDGNPWNITLQTGPNNGSRQNVSIALSTDEGDTFGTPKTICPRGSAYSAVTVMGDGTLGVYYEENGLFGGYTMRFVRFSLDWASNGTYKFTEEQPFHPVMSKVTTEVSEGGWQTFVAPFDCELPSELTAYTTTGETRALDTDAASCRALVCDPIEGRTLKAHTPYLLQGTPGQYTFQRPIAEWQATALPENCEMRNGALQGHYVNRLVKQNDAETIYNNIRSFSALNGEYAFRRITKNNAARIDAYRCNLQLPAANELYLQPTVRQAVDGIQGTEAAPTVKQQAYDLTGRPAKPNQRGIVIVPGKGIIMQ